MRQCLCRKIENTGEGSEGASKADRKGRTEGHLGLTGTMKMEGQRSAN